MIPDPLPASSVRLTKSRRQKVKCAFTPKKWESSSEIRITWIDSALPSKVLSISNACNNNMKLLHCATRELVGLQKGWNQAIVCVSLFPLTIMVLE